MTVHLYDSSAIVYDDATVVYSSVGVPYSLHVTDAAGTSYGSVTSAINVRPTWELNGAGSLAFDLQTVDAAAALMIPTQREVQLWYDNGTTSQCVWWGPVWRRECQGKLTHIQCRGLASYLETVQLGPILSNYLVDPDFENAALPNWTVQGTATQSSDTVIVRKGARSLKLVSSAQGLDNFSFQQFTFDNSTGAEPVAVSVRARCYITATTGTPFIGPALNERGLFVKRIEGGVDQTEATGQVGVYTTLSNSAPRNQWVRVFAPQVSIPAGHTQTVEVRCYSPGGTINWDTSIAAIDESTGANTVSTYADVNTIVSNALTYAQDTTKNKTNFRLAGPAGSFGTSLSRQWQFYDHGFFWDVVVKPLVDAGVLDVDVTFSATAPTTRTLQTYTSKGAAVGVTLTVGSNADVSGYPEDGTAIAGAITVLPQGMNSEPTLGTPQPAADDVGYAVDTAANAGVVLEKVISATPESTLDQMAAQATVELARRKNLQGVAALVTPADTWWSGGAGIGDTVTFAGSYGWVGGAAAPLGSRRVVKLDLVPEANLMVVTGQ